MKKVNKILDDIGDDRLLLPIVPLYKKWSFIVRISSVSVTKSAVLSGFGHIYWRIP